MAEKKLRPGQKVKMVSVDELLGVSGEETSLELDISRIQPFQNHPFKVVDDDKMEDLVNSIRLNGVLTPVLVRPTDEGGYEMISGHRRMHAAERAGLMKIPAIIRELTDDAMKRQAGRPDKNSPQVGTNFRADEEVAKQVGESKNQVYRFIRLTELIPELLDMVDIKKMPLMTAVKISYIEQKVQKYLYEYIKENGMVKSYQVTALRKYLEDFETGGQAKMISILNENLPGKTQPKAVTFSEKKLRQYFSSNYTVSDMEKIIVRLMEKWKAEQEAGSNGV